MSSLHLPPLRATAEDTVNYSSAGVKEPPSGLTYLDPFIATVPPGSVHHDHKACDPSGSSDPSDHLYPRPVFLLQAPQLELVVEVEACRGKLSSRLLIPFIPGWRGLELEVC